MNSPSDPDSQSSLRTFSPDERRRGFLFIGVAVGCVGAAMALQMGLNANFMADVIKVTGAQMGLIEGLRETCGITALAVIALLAGAPEPLVGSAMLVLLSAGLAGYGLAPSIHWVMLMSLVWSMGLHVWMPLPNSMTLSLSEPGQAGYRLGKVGACGAMGTACGLVLALILTRANIPMRSIYFAAGVVGILGSLACLGIPRSINTPGPSLVFRRRYGLYYALCFLEGWRKQIFMCFAGFLLVRRYGTRVETILALMCVVQAIGYFGAPRIGRLIDRVGERRILLFYFTCLALFFLGYILLTVRWVLYILFVVDSSFFLLGMALTTYVKKIVPQEERTPTLSMGVAMNHIAAVTMPLIGGYLWEWLDPRWVFATGSLAALLSIPVAARLPKPTAQREA